MPKPQSPPALCWWLTVVGALSCGLLHALHCPAHCQCQGTTMDCSHSRLSAMPHVPAHTWAWVVNLSSNSLTSLDDLHQFPVSQTSLDLSFNRISSIPLHTFSGRQFVELHTLNLTSNLLAHLRFVFPSSLQVLKLSRNEIQHFCVDRLRGLPQLRVLHLEWNHLKTLACKEDRPDKRSSGVCPFQPLQEMVEVSLRGNKLKDVGGGTLDCFHNTQFLSLADNALTFLPPKLFQKFHHLKYLDLSGNQLTFIPEGMFGQMPNLRFLSVAHNRLNDVPLSLPMLEWLDLSHNAITAIPERQKADLYPQEVFLIGGNPLHCVCELLWLKELYDTREYLLKFINIEHSKFIPTCASPDHIRGDTWDVLGDEAFGCKVSEDVSKSPSAVRQEKDGADHTEELAVKVRDVGTTHIRLVWDAVHSLGNKPLQNRESRKVFISCHPFGRKQEKKTAVIQLTLGSHRLRGLQPSTAYVVCLSLGDPSVSSEPRFMSRGDCMEVVTKEDEHSKLRDIYMRISVVILVSVLLAIKCCYTNSIHKDVAARHKEE